MPKCKNDSLVSYTGIEPSPLGMGYCASGVKVNTIMVGRNGKRWISTESGNGSGMSWEKYHKSQHASDHNHHNHHNHHHHHQNINDSDDMIDYRTKVPIINVNNTNNNKQNNYHNTEYSSESEESVNSNSENSVNSDESNNSNDSYDIDSETNQGLIKFINLESSITDYYVNKIHSKRINKEHLDEHILKKFNSTNTMKSLYKHAIYKYLTHSNNRSDLNSINETGMWKSHNDDRTVNDVYYSVLEHITATTKFKKMDEFCKK